MVFVCVCLLSARVKDQILWKLDTLICEKVVSFKFAIWFQHIAQPWSYLEQIGRGTIFWSIRHIFAWFFSKMCCHWTDCTWVFWYRCHNMCCNLGHLWKSMYCRRSNFMTFPILLEIEFLQDWIKYLCQKNYVNLMHLFFR